MAVAELEGCNAHQPLNASIYPSLNRLGTDPNARFWDLGTNEKISAFKVGVVYCQCVTPQQTSSYCEISKQSTPNAGGGETVHCPSIIGRPSVRIQPCPAYSVNSMSCKLPGTLACVLFLRHGCISAYASESLLCSNEHFEAQEYAGNSRIFGKSMVVCRKPRRRGSGESNQQSISSATRGRGEVAKLR